MSDDGQRSGAASPSAAPPEQEGTPAVRAPTPVVGSGIEDQTQDVDSNQNAAEASEAEADADTTETTGDEVQEEPQEQQDEEDPEQVLALMSVDVEQVGEEETQQQGDEGEQVEPAQPEGEAETVEATPPETDGDTTQAEATEEVAETADDDAGTAEQDADTGEATEPEQAADDGEQQQEKDGPNETEAEEQRPASARSKASSTGSRGKEASNSPPPPTQTDVPSTLDEPINLIPEAPKVPSPERTESEMEGTMSNTALNIVWSFGLNRNVPVLNLTDDSRKVILYACAHVGVLYDFQNNKQHILQGHANPITSTCVSEDKHWLATGDKGKDSLVIIWDTYTGIPVQTLFDENPEGGVVALAMTADARYLATLSATKTQILAIWDWTVDGETPICTAELNPNFGVQNFIFFNPEDTHFLVTNSDSQVVFYHWDEGRMEYFAPPLTDQDFNKAVGRYSQSIFQRNSSRALTATSIGNLVVWDNNRPVTKVVSKEPLADKKALKIIRLQERGINVLTVTERYIVVGDMAGHVKFFDQSLKLVHWYQDFHLGPVTSVSFAHFPDFTSMAREGTNFPPDATIEARKFVIRDFVVGSSIAVFGNITADGTIVQVIHREHDAAIHSLSAHPSMPYLVVGSYSGLLKIWNYEKKQVLVSRQFDRGNLIRCCTYDPNGEYLAVGFVNGAVRVLDALTLQDEVSEPFRYSRDAITHIEFSHNSEFFATADAEYAVTVFQKQSRGEEPFVYLGRYRAHYKPIRDIMFGIQLDSNLPRLLSIGADRVLVEYDLENSCKDQLKLSSSDRIEQSAVPQCMTWYPPVTKEHFIVTANDQFKFKLFNATTKMCRKTLLGPTYGSPVQKMAVVPTKELNPKRRYMAYVTKDKVGLHILPLDGNPHNAMALIAHPAGAANLVCSHDGKYMFTAGGSDSSVHMWEINVNALEAQAQLGGEDLIPFYGLLDGGRDGELFSELEDHFYYAQIRSQGVKAMKIRQVSTRIALTEVPAVMRAMGFYPSEQEIEDMLNEVKFSRYVETGQYVEDIGLGEFIKLYINHRPAFGLSPEKLQSAFETLGIPTASGMAIERSELLDLLQSKGEHMTEYELAEYLTTLLGFNAEGGSSEMQDFDTSAAGDVIDENLPHEITAEMFANEVLGFSMFSDAMSARQSTSSIEY